MAYCYSHNTGTTTCSGHRGVCYSNRALSWGYDAVQGGIIYAAQIEEMRVAIINETTTWNAHAWYNVTIYNPGVVSAGTTITPTAYNYLDYTIDGLYGGSAANVGVGELVDDYNWDVLLSRYNAVRQNCICNSDCSCNAICACYGDCGCNYSDSRLKENIEFVRTENNINVYTWNYVWDQINRHTGVMAQELLTTEYKHAVTTDKNGYYMVNYNKLPITI